MQLILSSGVTVQMTKDLENKILELITGSPVSQPVLGRPKGGKNKPRRRKKGCHVWTPEEDQQMMSLKQANWSAKAIAKQISARDGVAITDTAVNSRYSLINKQKGQFNHENSPRVAASQAA